jgi:hypothetical protein
MAVEPGLNRFRLGLKNRAQPILQGGQSFGRQFQEISTTEVGRGPDVSAQLRIFQPVQRAATSVSQQPGGLAETDSGHGTGLCPYCLLTGTPDTGGTGVGVRIACGGP